MDHRFIHICVVGGLVVGALFAIAGKVVRVGGEPANRANWIEVR